MLGLYGKKDIKADQKYFGFRMEIDKIFNQDCIGGMKNIPDESIDLIVTDPPYKLTARGNSGTMSGYWTDEMIEGLAEEETLIERVDGKLKLESIKRVREYWSEYARIFIEIYDDEPNECVLTHLYTLEGHRQKGYGQQALSEAESIAKELGCHTAYLKVETDSWMHQWYLRCGYNWYKDADEGYTWLIKKL